ncbi:MAG: hypothetical protein N2654_02405 [Deltaproteobacteria bacterium]|nr:hypothetical protein [Deltaproteobacteria bacterium]
MCSVGLAFFMTTGLIYGANYARPRHFSDRMPHKEYQPIIGQSLTHANIEPKQGQNSVESTSDRELLVRSPHYPATRDQMNGFENEDLSYKSLLSVKKSSLKIAGYWVIGLIISYFGILLARAGLEWRNKRGL